MRPLRGSQYCYVHSPTTRNAHLLSASRGGKGNLASQGDQPDAADLDTPEGLEQFIKSALVDAAEGRISAQHASAVNSLARTLLTARKDKPADSATPEKAKGLTHDELQAEVLAAMPVEALEAEIARRTEG